jgi:spore germination protein
VTTTSYLGFETVMLFQPYMNRPGDAGKALLIAMPVITVFYLIVVIITVSVFSINEVQKLIWPSLSLFRLVKLPGAFLENIHGILMAIWVASVFMTLSGFYFGAVLTLSRLMRIKEHSLLVLPLAPVIYFLSLVPDNIPEVYDLLNLFSLYLGIPFGFIFPAGLYILARVRGLKPEKGGDDGKTTFKGR